MSWAQIYALYGAPALLGACAIGLYWWEMRRIGGR